MKNDLKIQMLEDMLEEEENKYKRVKILQTIKKLKKQKNKKKGLLEKAKENEIYK